MRGKVRGLAWALLALSGLGPGLARAGEAELRARLGVPAEARSVLVFAQSSHVDPDWLLSADQYQRFTDQAFDRAWDELAQDPRYVYSVECIFFFKRYWDDHPERQAGLREYVNQGRIRFTGTGVTTPDTLLPEGESILRDYLIGREWLWSQGMKISPAIAYLPDDFGHSPSLPTMLRELGIKYAALGRIDGKYSFAADYWPPERYPWPGSNAELLYDQLQTLDFVWQGPDRAEIVTHVAESGTNYDMADLIEHKGGAVMMGIYLAVPDRSVGHTNQKIDDYISQLAPLSRTGYMFCSIGGDFNPPVPDLNRVLDDYNRIRYPDTGVWAVLAGLEDYMELVSYHRDLLPVLNFDPNPYWTGFYSSRPGLKQQCRQLTRSLLLAETLAVIAHDRALGLPPDPDLAAPWYTAAMSNHHDFITGTSRDRVVRREQLPLLLDAQAAADNAITQLSGQIIPLLSILPMPMSWTIQDGVFRAQNDYYEIELDAARGGCITRWYDRVVGREVLAGPSNDIVVYNENGGLYKMGMELIGGRFREVARASSFPARISAEQQHGVLAVSVESKFSGHSFVRTMYLRSDSPVVRLQMKGAAKRRQTVTVAFRPALEPGRFTQEAPYGVVDRPLEKFFPPTFWAVKNWVDLRDRSEQFGVALAVAAPGAVTARPDGTIEAVALRNAPRELPKGIPAIHSILAHGSDPDPHEFDYAFWPRGAETWLDQRVFAQAAAALSDDFISPGGPDLQALAASLVTVDRPDVIVTAVKPAESGDGVIIRLFRYAPEPVRVRLVYNGRPVTAAFRANALEQTLEPLPVTDNQVELDLPYALATVLLRR